MRECAFCPQVARLTGEHIWSDWINKIFPSKKYEIVHRGSKGEVRRWFASSLNLTVPVVCSKCNNGWMSDLENKHAKPAMQDLILSDRLASLSEEQLSSIAKFAFKCIVIADHSAKPRRPSHFFARDARHRFATSLEIPRGFQVWLAAFKHDGHGLFRGLYHESAAEISRSFEMYALTFGAGYFVFQALGSRWLTKIAVSPGYLPFATQGQAWDKFSIPSWPLRRGSIAWPPRKQLTLAMSEAFAQRWGAITVPSEWTDINYWGGVN